MNTKGYTIVELLLVLVGIGLICLIPVIAIWTGHNLDFWISHFKGHAVHVPYWLSLLITIVGNGVVIAANIVSEILKFAV